MNLIASDVVFEWNVEGSHVASSRLLRGKAVIITDMDNRSHHPEVALLTQVKDDAEWIMLPSSDMFPQLLDLYNLYTTDKEIAIMHAMEVLYTNDPEFAHYTRADLDRVEIGIWQWHGEPSHSANVELDGKVVDCVVRSYYWLDDDGNYINPDEYDGDLDRDPDGETLEFGDDEVDLDHVNVDNWVAQRCLAMDAAGMYEF